jgi:hypothetical protein
MCGGLTVSLSEHRTDGMLPTEVSEYVPLAGQPGMLLLVFNLM